MEMPNEGVRDEGAAGGVPATTTGGCPMISAPGRLGKRDEGAAVCAPELGKGEEGQSKGGLLPTVPLPTFPPEVLDLSARPKPVTGSPDTCLTPGNWSPETCSRGSSVDIASDDWRMLTLGTCCPDTRSPDTRSLGSSAKEQGNQFFVQFI